jgi:hypothetical protein
MNLMDDCCMKDRTSAHLRFGIGYLALCRAGRMVGSVRWFARSSGTSGCEDVQGLGDLRSCDLYNRFNLTLLPALGPLGRGLKKIPS